MYTIKNFQFDLEDIMGDKHKWPVERYSQCINKAWVETTIEKGNCALLIRDSQLLLVNKDIVLEMVCLAGGAGLVKSSYSNDNLGILVQNQATISKFRVKFDNSPSQSSVSQCLSCVAQLKKFIKVTNPASTKHTIFTLKDAVTLMAEKTFDYTTETEMQIKTIHEMALVLTHNDQCLGLAPLEISSTFLEKFPVEEFVRQCILDPGLPLLVGKVEKTLKKIKDTTNK